MEATRWNIEEPNRMANLVNMPTAVNGTLTPEQVEAHALSLRIEEITNKLRLNDVVPPQPVGGRSPSPPPQYDSQGRRTNTREVRYRLKLEEERHRLVDKALRTIPNFRPPSDYKRPQRTQEKIYIPVNDYPEINFIGLLIGPRGKTLKQMETESGAKIAIRGRGSVKEGKGSNNNRNNAISADSYQHNNLDEDLHCLVISDSDDKIQKAIELVNRVIETAASIPEGQNELKRGQLRELAALNGTLRDDEGQPCQNCGEVGHRKYDCPNMARKNSNSAIATNSIVCRICGNQGHFARDCKERVGRSQPQQQQSIVTNPSGTAADKEYEQLMNELGAGPPNGNNNNNTNANITNTNNNNNNNNGFQPPLPQPSGNVNAPWQHQPWKTHNNNNNPPPIQQQRQPQQQAPPPPPPVSIAPGPPALSTQQPIGTPRGPIGPPGSGGGSGKHIPQPPQPPPSTSSSMPPGIASLTSSTSNPPGVPSTATTSSGGPPGVSPIGPPGLGPPPGLAPGSNLPPPPPPSSQQPPPPPSSQSQSK